MQPLNFTNSSSVSYTDMEYNKEIFHLLNILNKMFISITFVLGTVGNGLVIWIYGFQMKKTINTIWFLNLSIADFSFCFLFFLQLLNMMLSFHWFLGQIMCKVMFTSLFLNIQVSTFFLVAISVDRCISVLCPVWSKIHRSVKLARNISVIIWLLGLALVSPYFAFFDIEHYPNGSTAICTVTYATSDNITWHARHKAMNVTNGISWFLIPFPVISVCYGLIAFRIRKSNKRLGSSRTFKVIVTVVLCFFCCTFLFPLLSLLEFMNVEINGLFHFIMSGIAACVKALHSCLNPVIYAFVSQDFKISLRKSIPFLLKKAFREKDDPLEARDNADVGNELVPCHV